MGIDIRDVGQTGANENVGRGQKGQEMPVCDGSEHYVYGDWLLRS
jgi:hypothetical protein